MDVVIETDRLLLRKFTEDDASLLYELNLDPEVIRYTHDPMTDVEHARKVLVEIILPQYSLYDYGRWAVHLKPNLEFIGWCGLKYLSETSEVDLGYRLLKKFWGRGYATEAARGCIEYGFVSLNLQQIVGRALAANLSSIKVLEKCGMEFLREEVMHGYLHKTYQVTNPAIKS
jgi:[ribosomal protein S5]-alanine N-acetyltransferase